MPEGRGGRASGLLPRLVAAFLTVALAAIAVVALLTYVAARAQVTSSAAQEREEAVAGVAASLESAHEMAGGWAAADLTPAVAQAAATAASLEVVDVDGRGVADRDVVMNNMMAGMRGPDQASDADVREVTLTVDDAPIGTATLRFPGDGIAGRDAQLLAALGRTALISALVAALLALAMALFVARRITQPLRLLAAVVQRFSQGEPGARADATAAGEVGQVAVAFNRMADVLARRDQQRRQLAATVAHELRTPIAVLRATLEAMQDGIVQPTPDALASLDEELVRLTRNVTDLQALSDAEGADLSIVHAQTDLAQVAADAAQALQPLYDSGDVTLDRDLRHVDVRGDADRLRQVVTNLLSNALKFTPRDGVVTMMVRSCDGHAELTVTDAGPGIPAEDQALVFEPFWRGADAQGVSGHGLGLTIVAELVRAHGGTVDVHSEGGHGAAFVVRLPRSR